MPRVELIYDLDCPNIGAARGALLKGFAQAGLRPAWEEWDRRAPASPPHAARYGSPTILVEGRDVAGAEPSDGADACRVYDHGLDGLRGVPPIPRIAAALRGARAPSPTRKGRGWWRPLAALPGAGAALLPVGLCPACWPAYAGVLGSLGLGFLIESTYLLALTAAFLGLALLALGFRASTRQGYRPLALGIASALVILAFKFVYPVAPLVYAGLVGLVAASAWNAWPKRSPAAGSCPKCVRKESATATRNSRYGDSDMATKRTIEVFSAGCAACEDTIRLVNSVACPSCEVTVLDMREPAVSRRASSLGIRSVPAVVINGKLADCCTGRGPEEAVLRVAGLGRP